MRPLQRAWMWPTPLVSRVTLGLTLECWFGYAWHLKHLARLQQALATWLHVWFGMHMFVPGISGNMPICGTWTLVGPCRQADDPAAEHAAARAGRG